MRRIQRIACAAVACTCLLAGVQTALMEETFVQRAAAAAEEKPVGIPAEEAAATPAPQQSAAPEEAAPVEIPLDSGAEPTPVPSTQPSATVEPTGAAEPAGSAEPVSTLDPMASIEPTEEPLADPTGEPPVEPTPEPSLEPSPANLFISVEGESEMQDGVALLSVQPMQATIAFTWSCDWESVSYVVYTVNAEAAVAQLGEIPETRIELNAADYVGGTYAIFVGARPANGTEADMVWASLKFAIKTDGGQAGGFDGRGGYSGFGGGSGYSGSVVSGGAQEAQGFRIVPGVALTDAHSSGTKDMTQFGAVPLELTDAPMQKLTLGNVALEIGMESGTATFLASLDGDRLILTPGEDVQASGWALNGRDIRTLGKSGVSTLIMSDGARELALPTGISLMGDEFARLCKLGYVSKDYVYHVDFSADQPVIRVTVAGLEYLLSDAGELIVSEF